MKQSDDCYTLDLLGARPRGRPRKPGAKTGAQRQREYRARKKLISVTSDKKSGENNATAFIN